ncbi:oxygen-insensitive NADPH nitroreductase [Alkalicoccus luteus]|uniref:Oxygen-insensitive NADPH nitroreductase n=1 Tax=Alkalicoccus luteus TaxID=1237094 RepID=A0A969PRP7_9BACI|nr:oxygen-insensitive NADPH nitroreductase [Alkalicoccus luteus]NJP39176.1 oxygen-insensitive NADPH nitroreductase [Alkalicoccus luteus]
MNETIELLQNHRSIRKLKDEPLSGDVIHTLVESAQMASTSSFVQAYSIIGVTDRPKKEKLAQLAGNQPYVAENGHFFVFCADFHRHIHAGEMEQTDVIPAIESAEKMIVAVTDAALAAQNCSIAAESMGLGICYIGGLRNNIEEVSELLQLPDYVIPLFGIAVGFPEAEPDRKPRLPLEGIYFENAYPAPDKHTEQLRAYNDTISAYYEERTAGARSDRWTQQVSGLLKDVKRPHMKQFLENKGYNRR